ncbi:hypothetical protein [Streptomyces sp. NPDC006527]|uniref:hypothetical protein n=1 Tax=Streptomyces sp. NPDC006527 TaxID=3364749 RepID=UPI003678AA9E
MPPHMPPACLPLAAAVDQYHCELAGSGLSALVAARYREQPQNARLLDRIAAQWLQPGHLRHAARVADLNLLAYALAKAGRTEEAGRAFHATENLVCPWPWQHEGDPVERYAHRRRRCGRRAGGGAGGAGPGVRRPPRRERACSQAAPFLLGQDVTGISVHGEGGDP